MDVYQKSIESFHGQFISIDTGELARQANGSVRLVCGNCVLLATAVMSSSERDNCDFLPLTVEFSEKFYASGKIPGGFLKRESRPSTDSVLLARLVDRSLRPLFPDGFFRDVQVVVTVLSYDPDVLLESVAIVAASAALGVSDIPLQSLVGAVVVGRMDGEFVINPSFDQLVDSDINLVVAGTKEAILMVESGSSEISEEDILEAIMLGHRSLQSVIDLQQDLVNVVAKEKALFLKEKPEFYDDVFFKVKEILGNKIRDALRCGDKRQVNSFLFTLENEVMVVFEDQPDEVKVCARTIFSKLKKDQIRATFLLDRLRPDGRAFDEIREVTARVRILPSPHGTALFTRGETQSLGVVTLGSSQDEQIKDTLMEGTRSRYFFHYNFPPFSVGEVGMIRTGRRELGHGALAERALLPVLPKGYPYTIRIVSEILESNGSSSMASVCSGSLALMDAGVPISSGVSGIAMGLILDGEGGRAILSDIQGLEDYYGDMDFKVAGTKKGITALQLDIKVSGLSKDILKEALEQAKKGRLQILSTMDDVLSVARDDRAESAPVIKVFEVDTSKVGSIIGPGGRVIKKIQEMTGATISISEGDPSLVEVYTKDSKGIKEACQMIKSIVEDPEIGSVFSAKVVKIVAFGVFVEFALGREGLIHVSKLSKGRINDISEVISIGDTFDVRLVAVDDKRRFNFVPVKLF